MGHGCVPVKPSDYGISASTSVSKLSVAWLIKKAVNGEIGKIQFFVFILSFFRGVPWIEI